MNCFMAELARVVEMQLRFDSRPIGVDRADSEMKLVADLARAASMADELEDLEFSIGQLGDSVFTFSAGCDTFEDA